MSRTRPSAPPPPTARLKRRVARRRHCRGPWHWLWPEAWNIMTTLSSALRVLREEQNTRQQDTARSADHNDKPELTRALRESMEEQRTSQQTTARSTDPNDNPELTRALRVSREEQKTRQQATARSAGHNDDLELTRALRALMEEQRTRQQAEGREEQGTAVDPETCGGSAEEETNEEAPPQKDPAPVTAGSRGNRGQMDATNASGKATGQGWDHTTLTEEEQVACAMQRSMVKAGAHAMQRSMAEAGRDEAPA